MINFGNKPNVIISIFAAKLGFATKQTQIYAQKID